MRVLHKVLQEVIEHIPHLLRGEEHKAFAAAVVELRLARRVDDSSKVARLRDQVVQVSVDGVGHDFSSHILVCSAEHLQDVLWHAVRALASRGRLAAEKKIDRWLRGAWLCHHGIRMWVWAMATT